MPALLCAGYIPQRETKKDIKYKYIKASKYKTNFFVDIIIIETSSATLLVLYINYYHITALDLYLYKLRKNLEHYILTQSSFILYDFKIIIYE